MNNIEQLLEDSLAFEQNNQKQRNEAQRIPASGVPRMTSTNLADDLGTKKNFGAPVEKGQKES